MTIQSLAKQLYDSLETAPRQDGTEFLRLKEGSPPWMQEVVRAAHGDMMPDDWRYKFVEDACQAIIEHEDDRDSAFASLEADIYTHDLLQWCASNLRRPEYVNETIGEYSLPVSTREFDILRYIGWGQLHEKEETFNLLYNALEALAAEQEDAA